jgi:hypothetical protein
MPKKAGFIGTYWHFIGTLVGSSSPRFSPSISAANPDDQVHFDHPIHPHDRRMILIPTHRHSFQ